MDQHVIDFSNELNILGNKLNRILDNVGTIPDELREEFKSKLALMLTCEGFRGLAIGYWIDGTNEFWVIDGKQNKEETFKRLLLFVMSEPEDSEKGKQICEILPNLSVEMTDDCWKTISKMIKLSIMYIHEQRAPRLDMNGKNKYTKTYMPKISLSSLKKVWV